MELDQSKNYVYWEVDKILQTKVYAVVDEKTNQIVSIPGRNKFFTNRESAISACQKISDNPRVANIYWDALTDRRRFRVIRLMIAKGGYAY